jgi:VanZ family protein
VDTDSMTIPDGDSGRTAGEPDLTRSPSRTSLPMNATCRRLVVATALAFWGALFVSTHIPLPILDELPQNSDKVMHFTAYGGLAFLLGLWRGAFREMTFRDYAIIFAITAVYAIADELLQLIPALHRSCDIMDALADWIGSLCGLAALWLFIPIYRRFAPGYL